MEDIAIFTTFMKQNFIQAWVMALEELWDEDALYDFRKGDEYFIQIILQQVKNNLNMLNPVSSPYTCEY